MNDLISRQAAIDEIDEWIKAFRENGHKGSAADACLIQEGIIQLPSAEPEQKWIPVTERLPEEEGYYLTIGPYGAFRVCYYGSSLKHRGYQVFLDQNKKKINAIAWMIIPRYEIKEEK